jgi:hypothetical protein
MIDKNSPEIPGGIVPALDPPPGRKQKEQSSLWGKSDLVRARVALSAVFASTVFLYQHAVDGTPSYM